MLELVRCIAQDPVSNPTLGESRHFDLACCDSKSDCERTEVLVRKVTDMEVGSDCGRDGTSEKGCDSCVETVVGGTGGCEDGCCDEGSGLEEVTATERVNEENVTVVVKLPRGATWGHLDPMVPLSKGKKRRARVNCDRERVVDVDVRRKLGKKGKGTKRFASVSREFASVSRERNGVPGMSGICAVRSRLSNDDSLREISSSTEEYASNAESSGGDYSGHLFRTVEEPDGSNLINTSTIDGNGLCDGDEGVDHCAKLASSGQACSLFVREVGRGTLSKVSESSKGGRGKLNNGKMEKVECAFRQTPRTSVSSSSSSDFESPLKQRVETQWNDCERADQGMMVGSFINKSGLDNDVLCGANVVREGETECVSDCILIGSEQKVQLKVQTNKTLDKAGRPESQDHAGTELREQVNAGLENGQEKVGMAEKESLKEKESVSDVKESVKESVSDVKERLEEKGDGSEWTDATGDESCEDEMVKELGSRISCEKSVEMRGKVNSDGLKEGEVSEGSNDEDGEDGAVLIEQEEKEGVRTEEKVVTMEESDETQNKNQEKELRPEAGEVNEKVESVMRGRVRLPRKCAGRNNNDTKANEKEKGEQKGASKSTTSRSRETRRQRRTTEKEETEGSDNEPPFEYDENIRYSNKMDWGTPWPQGLVMVRPAKWMKKLRSAWGRHDTSIEENAGLQVVGAALRMKETKGGIWNFVNEAVEVSRLIREWFGFTSCEIGDGNEEQALEVAEKLEHLETGNRIWIGPPREVSCRRRRMYAVVCTQDELMDLSKRLEVFVCALSDRDREKVARDYLKETKKTMVRKSRVDRSSAPDGTVDLEGVGQGSITQPHWKGAARGVKCLQYKDVQIKDKLNVDKIRDGLTKTGMYEWVDVWEADTGVKEMDWVQSFWPYVNNDWTLYLVAFKDREQEREHMYQFQNWHGCEPDRLEEVRKRWIEERGANKPFMGPVGERNPLRDGPRRRTMVRVESAVKGTNSDTNDWVTEMYKGIRKCDMGVPDVVWRCPTDLQTCIRGYWPEVDFRVEMSLDGEYDDNEREYIYDFPLWKNDGRIEFTCYSVRAKEPWRARSEEVEISDRPTETERDICKYYKHLNKQQYEDKLRRWGQVGGARWLDAKDYKEDVRGEAKKGNRIPACTSQLHVFPTDINVTVVRGTETTVDNEVVYELVQGVIDEMADISIITSERSEEVVKGMEKILMMGQNDKAIAWRQYKKVWRSLAYSTGRLRAYMNQSQGLMFHMDPMTRQVRTVLEVFVAMGERLRRKVQKVQRNMPTAIMDDMVLCKERIAELSKRINVILIYDVQHNEGKQLPDEKVRKLEGGIYDRKDEYRNDPDIAIANLDLIDRGASIDDLDDEALSDVEKLLDSDEAGSEGECMPVSKLRRYRKDEDSDDDSDKPGPSAGTSRKRTHESKQGTSRGSKAGNGRKGWDTPKVPRKGSGGRSARRSCVPPAPVQTHKKPSMEGRVQLSGKEARTRRSNIVYAAGKVESEGGLLIVLMNGRVSELASRMTTSSLKVKWSDSAEDRTVKRMWMECWEQWQVVAEVLQNLVEITVWEDKGLVGSRKMRVAIGTCVAVMQALVATAEVEGSTWPMFIQEVAKGVVVNCERAGNNLTRISKECVEELWEENRPESAMDRKLVKMRNKVDKQKEIATLTPPNNELTVSTHGLERSTPDMSVILSGNVLMNGEEAKGAEQRHEKRCLKMSTPANAVQEGASISPDTGCFSGSNEESRIEKNSEEAWWTASSHKEMAGEEYEQWVKDGQDFREACEVLARKRPVDYNKLDEYATVLATPGTEVRYKIIFLEQVKEHLSKEIYQICWETVGGEMDEKGGVTGKVVENGDKMYRTADGSVLSVAGALDENEKRWCKDMDREDMLKVCRDMPLREDVEWVNDLQSGMQLLNHEVLVYNRLGAGTQVEPGMFSRQTRYDTNVLELDNERLLQAQLWREANGRQSVPFKYKEAVNEAYKMMRMAQNVIRLSPFHDVNGLAVVMLFLDAPGSRRKVAFLPVPPVLMDRISNRMILAAVDMIGYFPNVTYDQLHVYSPLVSACMGQHVPYKPWGSVKFPDGWREDKEPWMEIREVTQGGVPTGCDVVGAAVSMMDVEEAGPVQPERENIFDRLQLTRMRGVNVAPRPMPQSDVSLGPGGQDALAAAARMAGRQEQMAPIREENDEPQVIPQGDDNGMEGSTDGTAQQVADALTPMFANITDTLAKLAERMDRAEKKVKSTPSSVTGSVKGNESSVLEHPEAVREFVKMFWEGRRDKRTIGKAKKADFTDAFKVGLQKLEKQFELIPDITDEAKSYILALVLDDDAYALFASLPLEVQYNYPELRKQLSEELVDELHMSEIESKLVNLKQGLNESAAEYYRKIEKPLNAKFNKTDYPTHIREQNKIITFMRGLKDSVRDRTIRQRHESVKKCAEYADDQEALMVQCYKEKNTQMISSTAEEVKNVANMLRHMVNSDYAGVKGPVGRGVQGMNQSTGFGAQGQSTGRYGGQQQWAGQQGQQQWVGPQGQQQWSNPQRQQGPWQSMNQGQWGSYRQPNPMYNGAGQRLFGPRMQQWSNGPSGWGQARAPGVGYTPRPLGLTAPQNPQARPQGFGQPTGTEGVQQQGDGRPCSRCHKMVCEEFCPVRRARTPAVNAAEVEEVGNAAGEESGKEDRLEQMVYELADQMRQMKGQEMEYGNSEEVWQEEMQNVDLQGDPNMIGDMQCVTLVDYDSDFAVVAEVAPDTVGTDQVKPFVWKGVKLQGPATPERVDRMKRMVGRARLVKVWINNTTPIFMLFDTGATISVIGQKDAKLLHDTRAINLKRDMYPFAVGCNDFLGCTHRLTHVIEANVSCPGYKPVKIPFCTGDNIKNSIMGTNVMDRLFGENIWPKILADVEVGGDGKEGPRPMTTIEHTRRQQMEAKKLLMAKPHPDLKLNRTSSGALDYMKSVGSTHKAQAYYDKGAPAVLPKTEAQDGVSAKAIMMKRLMEIDERYKQLKDVKKADGAKEGSARMEKEEVSSNKPEKPLTDEQIMEKLRMGTYRVAESVSIPNGYAKRVRVELDRNMHVKLDGDTLIMKEFYKQSPGSIMMIAEPLPIMGMSLAASIDISPTFTELDADVTYCQVMNIGQLPIKLKEGTRVATASPVYLPDAVLNSATKGAIGKLGKQSGFRKGGVPRELDKGPVSGRRGQ